MAVTEKYIGEFLSSEHTHRQDCKCVGLIYRVGEDRYVIRGLNPGCNAGFAWESAEFKGTDFRKIRTMNYGCGQIVKEYTASTR